LDLAKAALATTTKGSFVIMGTDQTNHPNIKTLSAGEAIYLADRLYGRSVSTLMTGQPEMCRDMCMASRVIRALLHEVDRIAARCEADAHILRNLRIEVEGC
jgi:hypothetical protein